MADSILKSRHAFGTVEGLLNALAEQKIDAYDILFLKDANGKPHLGWVDKDGNPVIIREEDEVIKVDSLPEYGEVGKIYLFNENAFIWNGTSFKNLCTPTDVSALEEEISKKADAQVVDIKINAVMDNVENVYEKEKYEISHKPDGTIVNYHDKEIRVMCPANTVWSKQTVGETGNANMCYMGFKAYAPEGAVGFKEGDRGVIIDEYFDFSGDFAGTDEFGRNYSICWLALASCDDSGTWTYFGKNSSVKKYIGWDYVVEWYNADGIVIASDGIRINLSNEDCHSSIEPYYVSNVISEAKAYTDAQIEEKITEIIGVPVIEF